MADEYWFPWYPGHYERDAGHLDHIADSCYRRLIDFYMRGGEPIPKDPIRLMHITRTTAQQFQTVWPQIEGFFTLADGVLHLKRCNNELDRQDARKRFASEAGKKSAAKRSQQYQLLTNDRSTTVQPSFNDPRNDRTGQDKTVEIDSSAASNVYSVTAEAAVPPTPQPDEVKNGRTGKRGSRITADWNPSDGDIAFATEHGFHNGEITKAAAEFRDYWIAASGRNAIKLDWSATWRNRIRVIAERRPQSNGLRASPDRQRTGSLTSAMRNAMSGKTE